MPAAKAGNGKRPTVAGLAEELDELKRFSALSSAITSRAQVASRLGQSYGGDRDIYNALGYSKNPTFNDFMARYLRQDIAKAIIEVPVRACWRDSPEIVEAEDDETDFEKQWADLEKDKQIFHYLSRADRLASIGQYSVMFLGFDGEDASQEVTSANELLFLQVYSQDNADIRTWVRDVKNERYGLPETYNLVTTSRGGDAAPTEPIIAHWTRVIHVAEDRLESDVYGIPRLESVLNRLQDLELIAGSSAEMFWRGAYPGMAFSIQDKSTIGPQTLTQLRDEIEEYMHNLKRYLRLTGIDVTEMKPQVADPRSHVDVQLDLIAASQRIPRRVLLGSERGELASSQDERNWAMRVDERRLEYCEPILLRATIDRLIDVGVLPEPTDGYDVKWPDLLAQSEKEKVEVGQTLAQSLKAYVDAQGADQVVPPDVMLEKLGFGPAEIEKINEILDELEKEREAEEEEMEEAEIVMPPQPQAVPQPGEAIPAAIPAAAEEV
jgi:hypothetical protein